MMTPLIQPLLRDDALLADIASVRSRSDSLHLWWLGQSGYLLLWNGRFLLLDPYLSDSLTRKYAGTAKEHIRISERVIAPERLEFVDAVTSSHNHTDRQFEFTAITVFNTTQRLDYGHKNRT